MAQGQVLSLFVRLYESSGEEKWLDAAEHTWQSFSQPYSAQAPWSSVVVDDHLYLEEYAGDQPPLLVLNGQIFAAFGIYDYWRLTGSDEARSYLDGAMTTVLERILPLSRLPGGVSYYCVQADYCQIPRWQNQKYHEIHSWQLDTLQRLTGDSRFGQWATLLRADWRATRRVESSAETEGMDILDDASQAVYGIYYQDDAEFPSFEEPVIETPMSGTEQG